MSLHTKVTTYSLDKSVHAAKRYIAYVTAYASRHIPTEPAIA
ncbi:hypothetical protein [Bifidobacterium thermophilum]